MGSGRPLIVRIGGTLREGSYSLAALRDTLRIAEAEGATTQLLDLRELDLPMHVPDLEVDGYPDGAGSIRRLLDACRRADAFVWSSPTYHGTLSGIFKNALDMLELLADDEPPYLTGKPVGLISVSDAQPLIAMSSCVHELRAWTAPTRLTLTKRDFTDARTLGADAPQRRAARLARELISFATREVSRG